jgi:hypothetical protein
MDGAPAMFRMSAIPARRAVSGGTGMLGQKRFGDFPSQSGAG